MLTIGHWTASRLDSEQSLFVKPYPFQKVLMRLNDIIKQDHKPNVLIRGMGPSVLIPSSLYLAKDRLQLKMEPSQAIIRP